MTTAVVVDNRRPVDCNLPMDMSHHRLNRLATHKDIGAVVVVSVYSIQTARQKILDSKILILKTNVFFFVWIKKKLKNYTQVILMVQEEPRVNKAFRSASWEHLALFVLKYSILSTFCCKVNFNFFYSYLGCVFCQRLYDKHDL